MPANAPNDSSPQPHSAPRSASELHTCWKRVEVASAQIAREHGGACARAVIQLGGLTPADVRVELVPKDPGLADAVTPAERRMFSSLPYDNGCFVFEASLAPRDLALAREWSIRVHPHEGVGESPVSYQVRTSEEHRGPS